MDAHSLVEGQFDVPCNGCVACCTGQRVTMLPGDDASKYDLVEIMGEPCLRNKPNGDCTYLVRNSMVQHQYSNTGHCSIWEDRPLMCKEFDCRDMVRWMRQGKVRSMSPVVRMAGEKLIQLEVEKSKPEAIVQAVRVKKRTW